MIRASAVLAAAVAFVLFGDALVFERAERGTLAPALALALSVALFPSLRTRRVAAGFGALALLAVLGSAGAHSVLARIHGGRVRWGEVAINAALYLGPAAALTLAFAIVRRGAGAVAAIAATTVFALAYIPGTALTHRPKVLTGRTPDLSGALSYEEATLVTRDGYRLAATFIPPPASAPRPAPAVLILHGVGGEQTYFYPTYARLAHSLGFAALLFDFRGHGRSDGHTQAYGARELEDIRAALEWLRARPEVDRGRIAAIGHSMGSSVSILAAAAFPEIRAVVADAGYADLREVAAERLRFGILPRAAGRALGRLAWFCLASQAGLSGSIQPIDHVAAIAPRPLLLVHGDADRATFAGYSRALYEAAGEPKELLILPGIDHARGTREFTPELQRRVAALLGRAFGAPAAAAAPVRN